MTARTEARSICVDAKSPITVAHLHNRPIPPEINKLLKDQQLNAVLQLFKLVAIELGDVIKTCNVPRGCIFAIYYQWDTSHSPIMIGFGKNGKLVIKNDSGS